jgi:hypothetical protein
VFQSKPERRLERLASPLEVGEEGLKDGSNEVTQERSEDARPRVVLALLVVRIDRKAGPTSVLYGVD